MKQAKNKKPQKKFSKYILILKLVILALQFKISNAIDAIVEVFPTTVGSISTMNISIMMDASLGKGGIITI